VGPPARHRRPPEDLLHQEGPAVVAAVLQAATVEQEAVAGVEALGERLLHLTDQFANGTVLFQGHWPRRLGEDGADVAPQQLGRALVAGAELVAVPRQPRRQPFGGGRWTVDGGR